MLEGVRTSEGRFPQELAMYHCHHCHHGHHHHQQLFVLWQCWCQGKVSCNSSERLQLVTSYHLLQLQTALELNKYKYKTHNSFSSPFPLCIIDPAPVDVMQQEKNHATKQCPYNLQATNGQRRKSEKSTR